MSSKTKAFIGIILSVVFLIVIFTATGGYRGARVAESPKAEETCSAKEKVCENKATAQAETK